MKKFLISLIAIIIIFKACQGQNSPDISQDGKEDVGLLEEIKDLADNTFKNRDGDSSIFFDLALSPKKKTDNQDILKRNLQKEARSNERASRLYDNFESLKDVEQSLVGNDPDLIDFVYFNHNSGADTGRYEGESKDFGRKTPFYLQWDSRWAYNSLGQDNIGLSGCGPTSMAMILSRLSGDRTIYPSTIANDAKNYMVEEGIARVFFEDESKKFGYSIRDVGLSEEEMKKALESGPLLLSVGPGYFTLSGHILVIDSYDNGKFVINDPNSIKNSQRSRSYKEISDQIVHIWAFR